MLSYTASAGHRTLFATGAETARAAGSDAIPTDLPLRNRLLAALPPEELARVRREAKPVRLGMREILFERDTPIQHVYFPETAVVSLVNTLEHGGTVEIGTAGREGIAGLSVFLMAESTTATAVAQIPGMAWRIPVDAFLRLAAPTNALHRLLLRYTQAFLTQVAQTAACNAAHLVEQRCARWLLMTHDRVDGDVMPLTHEFLAFMLGVRRSGVTIAMRSLQDAKLIDYTRGRVMIVDRAGLEGASCECYRVVRAQFDQLLARAG
ncbi:MAG TPA: Crp/Fnr family transcriptional regulator [Gemmatimonadaceae bacterium]